MENITSEAPDTMIHHREPLASRQTTSLLGVPVVPVRLRPNKGPWFHLVPIEWFAWDPLGYVYKDLETTPPSQLFGGRKLGKRDI